MSDSTSIPLAEQLDHRDFVRRLACDLFGDHPAADDLEQEVWLATLRRSRPRAVAPRAWLAALATSLFRNRLRDERTRRQYEHGVVPADAVVSAEQVVQRETARKAVVDAVCALREPFRSTLLLHYFEELSSAEIARRTRTKAATVRSRLQRGLAQLRSDLGEQEPEHGVAFLWLAAPQPATWWSLGQGTALASTLGAIGMKTSAKATLALLVVIGCTVPWFFREEGNDASGQPERDHSSPELAADSAREGSSSDTVVNDATRVTPGSRQTAAQSVPATTGLTVFVSASATAVADAQVTFVSPTPYTGGADQHELLAREFRRSQTNGSVVPTDADGLARIDRIPAGSAVLFAHHDGQWGIASWNEHQQRTHVDIEIQRDVAVEVVVRDAEGRPAPDVPVAIGTLIRQFGWSARIRGRTSIHGEARFEHVQKWVAHSRSEELLVAAEGLFGELTAHPLDPTAPFPEPIELKLPPSTRLTVRLQETDGGLFQMPPNQSVRLEFAIRDSITGAVRRQSMLADEAETECGPVAWGLPFTVEASCDRAVGTVEALGRPDGAGNNQVDVVMLRTPLVSGRLVEETGTTPAQRYWVLTAFDPETGYRDAWFELAEDGSFEVAIPARIDDPSGVHVAIRSAGSTSLERRQVELRLPAGPGPFDVDAVTLRAPPPSPVEWSRRPRPIRSPTPRSPHSPGRKIGAGPLARSSRPRRRKTARSNSVGPR